MTVYRYKIKEVRQEEDALLAIIDMGMWEIITYDSRNVIIDKCRLTHG